MTTTAKKIRRLIREVRNPHYDRRCKYGIEAVKAFQIGEAFVIETPRNPDYPGEIRMTRVAKLATIYSRELKGEIMAASTPTIPQTLKETLALAGVMDYDIGAFNVLQRLFDAGSITPDQIIARHDEAEEELYQREAAEMEARK